jgi:hypothetical protein
VANNYVEDYLDEVVCRLIWDNISDFMPLGDFPAWSSNRSTVADKVQRFMQSRGYRDVRFESGNSRVRYRVTPEAAKVLVTLMRDEYEE